MILCYIVKKRRERFLSSEELLQPAVRHRMSEQPFDCRKGACRHIGSRIEALDNMLRMTDRSGQIMPGQEVSVSTAILPRTSANGYREAGAYLNGETVMAIGGGICQVSSTVYNAVKNAGLVVLERHPHSMPVHYLPLGLDAAISSGSKDLRFRNNYSNNLQNRCGLPHYLFRRSPHRGATSRNLPDLLMG